MIICHDHTLSSILKIGKRPLLQAKAIFKHEANLDGFAANQAGQGIPLVLLFLIAKVCVWSKRILGKPALLKWFFAEASQGKSKGSKQKSQD